MTGTGINHAKVVDTTAHPDDGSPVVGSDFNADHVINGDVNWNSKKITSLADPSSAQDAATKNYVDLASQGVQWKSPVRVATTSAHTLATDYENGDTIDGVVLATGDRILIKNQASATENGIYTVNASGAPTRATDADTGTEIKGSTVFATEGTVNADSAFINTNTTAITIGVTNITYVQFTGAAQITAGTGLSKSGNTLSIDTSVTMDLTSTQTLSGAKTFALAKISGAGAGVSTLAYANSASNTTFTIPATTGTAALLAQLTDGSTITGLVNAQFASDCALAFSKLAALSSANILVGNGSNVATSVAMSGDITIDNTGATTIGANKVTSDKLATAVNVIGKDDIWIPAVAMWVTTTNGATAVAKVETATNKLNIQYMDFPDSADSYAEFTWFTPRNWDASTVKATFIFQVASGGGTNAVKFGLKGVAVRDNVAIDTAYGTEQVTTTTTRVAANITVSAQTSAITIGNSPQAGDLVQFRVHRDTTDTETVTARLIGVRLEYGISQATAV